MALEVAAQWFETHTFSHEITLIREPHVLGGSFTNMWHVRGRDHDLLFDSGMGVLSLREHIAQLRDQGVICVASHSHFDHIGGHHEFEQRIIHRSEADILTSAGPDETVLTGYRDEAFNKLPYPGFRVDEYTVKGVKPTRVVEHGDVVDLGNRHFEVLHLPGHSPGSIALWEAKTRTLLSGDVVTEGQLLDELYHSCIDDYLDSLGRIRQLQLDIVLPGHREAFGRDRFVELIDQYIALRAKPKCPGIT